MSCITNAPSGKWIRSRMDAILHQRYGYTVGVLSDKFEDMLEFPVGLQWKIIDTVARGKYQINISFSH